MTHPATVDDRPSPRPRPAGAPPRTGPAHLRAVPNPATLQPEACNPAEDTPHGEDPQVSDLPGGADSEIALSARHRIAEFWASSRAYWTPPAVFTDRPASLAELADYARTAPWTHQQTGILRTAGLVYNRGFAYPYTVTCRYAEWFAQRPLRAAALLGGIKLTAMTGPGGWVVDHLIYPVAQFAGHVFL